MLPERLPTVGKIKSWRDTGAPLEAEKDEIDDDHKRPAWVKIELITGKGQENVKLQSFEDTNVWVPYCRDVAVSCQYVVK